MLGQTCAVEELTCTVPGKPLSEVSLQQCMTSSSTVTRHPSVRFLNSFSPLQWRLAPACVLPTLGVRSFVVPVERTTVPLRTRLPFGLLLGGSAGLGFLGWMASILVRVPWLPSREYSFGIVDGIAFVFSAAAAAVFARSRVNATWDLGSHSLVSSSGRVVSLPKGCRVVFATTGLGSETVERVQIIASERKVDEIDWPEEPKRWRERLAERGFDVMVPENLRRLVPENLRLLLERSARDVVDDFDDDGRYGDGAWD